MLNSHAHGSAAFRVEVQKRGLAAAGKFAHRPLLQPALGQEPLRDDRHGAALQPGVAHEIRPGILANVAEPVTLSHYA